MSEDKKTGFAAVIGRPNVGKSTLMNRIIGQKIAITSNKPQTTRNRIQTVFTDERGQIVFLDTPGMHKARTKLGSFMVASANSAIPDADVVLWLVEAERFIGEGDISISKILSECNRPVILVINKCDRLKKDELLPVIDAFRKLMDFSEIVPVSALNGDGVEELTEVIFSHLPKGPLYFDEETVTDQTMRQIAAELIREQTLRQLKDEIPHGIAVNIVAMTYTEKGTYNIEADIVCERDSHKGIIIGKGGSMLKKIGSRARTQIEEMTQTPVFLKLFVKVRKDWRDNETFLKEFGYK